MIEPLTPIYTAELFAPLNAELIALLRGLSDADWLRPTIARSWRVRDIAAHLLDGELRKLSFNRDKHRLTSAPPSSFADVVSLINGLNASGVSYAQRLSPRTIADLLEIAGGWVADLVRTLPPHGEAHFPVAWAGEARSENWMDIGREYTEWWHHQMQIRDAVGAPGLLQDRWLHPLLDLSVRAFNRSYEGVAAPPGTAVTFEVAADVSRAWSVVRESQAWRVGRGKSENPAVASQVDADTAWRILYNGLTAAEAAPRSAVTGDLALVAPMLQTRSVMV